VTPAAAIAMTAMGVFCIIVADNPRVPRVWRAVFACWATWLALRLAANLLAQL
jgi:hypothetical protein